MSATQAEALRRVSSELTTALDPARDALARAAGDATRLSELTSSFTALADQVRRAGAPSEARAFVDAARAAATFKEAASTAESFKAASENLNAQVAALAVPKMVLTSAFTQSLEDLTRSYTRLSAALSKQTALAPASTKLAKALASTAPKLPAVELEGIRESVNQLNRVAAQSQALRNAVESSALGEAISHAELLRFVADSTLSPSPGLHSSGQSLHDEPDE